MSDGTHDDERDGKRKELVPWQKKVVDAGLILFVFYFLGVHMAVYGLNYTNIDNRIVAARAYNENPAVAFEADIIQIIENPFGHTTTVCGAWKPSFEIKHLVSRDKDPAPCIEYETRGGHIYGWKRVA